MKPRADASAEPRITEEGERALVRRCGQGDERAWAELYRAYSPIVARFCGRLVGPDGPVEDVVQQVFVELFSSLRRFRGEARLTSWLYGVARNVAFKHFRGEGRRRKRDDSWAQEQPQIRSASDVGRAYEARALLHTAEAAVAQLPPKQRVVWVMRELEGLSTEEVAEALSIRPGTVRSRLFKARKQVLAALEARRRANPSEDPCITRDGLGDQRGAR